MMTRRDFLQTSTVAAAVRRRGRAAPNESLIIAMVTTAYKYLSHGQHLGDRFLVGYPRKGAMA